MGSPGDGFNRSYPATAESVPRVRSELTRFAIQAGARGERLAALRLAVSEAVTNGVLHAYDGTPGTIRVSASCVGAELWLLVSDDGSGLRPRGPHSGLGLGLAMIAQLADEFQIMSRSHGGTELRMQFRLQDNGRPQDRGRGQLRGSVSSAVIPA